MTRGMEEATAIAEACHLRDDFRWLAGGLCPIAQTLLNLLTRGPKANSSRSGNSSSARCTKLVTSTSAQ